MVGHSALDLPRCVRCIVDCYWRLPETLTDIFIKVMKLFSGNCGGDFRPDVARSETALRDWTSFVAICGLYCALVLRQLFNPSLGYPDADRILMDGVLIRDFLHDWPFPDIYGYVTGYYAQYPALSIGYRPPFFPFVEGVFNSVFGVQMWSSRLALLTFGIVGLTAFFATVRNMYGGTTALAGAALMATCPFVVGLSWYTMGEVPVLSMALLTIYFYHQYLSHRKSSYLAATAFSAVLAVWTKQTAFFLLLWMLFHQLTSGALGVELRQRRVWIAIAFIILALLPLAAITLWLGDQNLAQSIGMEWVAGKQAFASATAAAGLIDRFSPERIWLRLHQLYAVHLTMPALLLSMVGLLWATIKKDLRAWFWLSFILVVFMVFTYIKGMNSRYPIFWIPAFLVFASLPLNYLRRGSKHAFHVYSALLVSTVAWQVFSVVETVPKFATGYDAAARYILEHSDSPTVFFDGYNNGYFIYFMRALDPQRSMYVLRGDKLLSSTSIGGRSRLEIHARGANDIREMMERFGVQYVVVEDKNTIGIPIHDVLREMLNDVEQFALVKTISVDTGSPSTREPLKGVSLLIYEVLDRGTPEDGILELKLPVVGQTLRIPLRDLKDRSVGR